MKTLLSLSVIFLLCFQSFGQDPELFQTWYLRSIDYEIGLVILVEDFDPPIAPSLTISSSFDFNGDGACNMFLGHFNFNLPNELLTDSFVETTNPCGVEQDMFEQRYFNFLNDEFGLYYFITTDVNGVQTLNLSDTIFSSMIFKNVPLGADQFLKETVAIFPNPVSENLLISSEGIAITSYTIYTINGEPILSEKGDRSSIDVSSLSEGMYFLEILSEEGKSLQRFVKI